MVHAVTAPRAPERAASGTDSTLRRVVVSSPAAKGVTSPLSSTKLQIWKPYVSFYLTIGDSLHRCGHRRQMRRPAILAATVTSAGRSCSPGHQLSLFAQLIFLTAGAGAKRGGPPS